MNHKYEVILLDTGQYNKELMLVLILNNTCSRQVASKIYLGEKILVWLKHKIEKMDIYFRTSYKIDTVSSTLDYIFF